MAIADALAPAGVASRAAIEACCAHCAGPVSAGLVEPGAERQYCCGGCRTAFAILHDHGLDGFYALPDRVTTPVAATGRSFDEFDHPAFHELYVRGAPGGLARVELYLEGVHCGSCVWLVERVPLLLPGVARAELEVRRSLARIEWDPATVALSAVARQLDRLGYRPHPFRGVQAETMRRREDRAMLVRIGVSGAIAMNVMLAALAMYAGWFGGMDREYERFFRWLSLALTGVTLAWPGSVFFTSAWRAIRARALHMDVPIALALAVGFARGAINTWRDAGPVYFEGMATLTFALLAGRYLQQRGQRLAADSTELMHSLAPSEARVVEGETVAELPASALLPDMVLDVRAGDALAADGVVVRGESSLDLSLLTGESRPQTVREGDAVYTGTLNLSAPLRVRVTGAGEGSRLAGILRDVERGATRRAPAVLLADRVAARFIGVVLVLAALTVTVWWRRCPSDAIDHAIALLVVTCPCALALATPLAVSTAIGRAARAGILVKGGDVVEQLARPGTMLLDKTGTVTESRTVLAWWKGPDWARPLVLALEAGSLHPLAEGFRRAWPDVEVAASASSRHVAGGGVEGIVNGREVVIGAPYWVRARCRLTAAIGALPETTLTPVWIAVDGELVAVAGFGDPVRVDSPDAVAWLRARGWTVRLLSGDDPRVAVAVGARLGLAPDECTGGASPEDKRRVVEERTRAGERVVMVGDGVNDAAAMAAAAVSVGVHGGAEACLATADVSLARPGLGALVRLVEGSQRTLAIIRRNMLWAFAYNAVGATLAMTGHLSPLIASVMMPVASVTVIVSSWRSRTFTEEESR